LQLRFKEAGTVGSNIDFGKMANTILDFYSIDGANNMAVSELELVEQTIPLGINSTALQSFRFSIAENSIPAGFEAVLEDKFLNTQTVLTTGTNYDFSIDATAASQGIARFDIVLKTTSPLSVIDNTLDTKIIIWPNPAHNQFFIKNNQQEGDATIKIYSMTGQLIHSDKAVPGATTTLNANGWASGHYILEATHNGAKTTKQLIIQ
jgi:trimeric autotransporter adhesin